MRIHELLSELHHVHSDEYKPIKHDDTITVYHGFRDLNDAAIIAKHGLSGAKRANRVYSYEGDNNPRGLFVTPALKAAGEFTGSYKAAVIMQFDARLSELEAPVWPGGGWTGQGQMAQYFGHGAPGRAKRNQARADMENKYRTDQEHLPEWVKLSDNPHLAHLLTTGREPQALFIGHLNPARITGFHIQEYGSNWNRQGEQYFVTPTEFIEKYTPEDNEKLWNVQRRVFKPDEEFDPNLFKERMMEKNHIRNFDQIMGWQWEDAIEHKNNAAQTFAQAFSKYLWPKQLPAAFNWLKRTYGRKQND